MVQDHEYVCCNNGLLMWFDCGNDFANPRMGPHQHNNQWSVAMTRLGKHRGLSYYPIHQIGINHFWNRTINECPACDAYHIASAYEDAAARIG